MRWDVLEQQKGIYLCRSSCLYKGEKNHISYLQWKFVKIQQSFLIKKNMVSLRIHGYFSDVIKYIDLNSKPSTWTITTKFSEIPVYEISLQKSVPSIKWLVRRHNGRKTSI